MQATINGVALRGVKAREYRRKVYPVSKPGAEKILHNTGGGWGEKPTKARKGWDWAVANFPKEEAPRPFHVSMEMEYTYQVEFSSDRMLVCWSLDTAKSMVDAMRKVREKHGPSTIIHRIKTVAI